MKVGFFAAPLLCFVSVAAPIQVLAASQLEAGEIALEGPVLAISPGKIELSAELFWLPNGKSRPILPAKTKTIEFEPNVAFTAANNVALSSLIPGSKVRVAGRDLGAGKSLPARRIEFLGGALADLPKAGTKPEIEPVIEASKPVEKPKWDRSKPIKLEPPETPFEPIEGGEERKFRITDSGFAVESSLSGWKGQPNWRSAPTFFARYEDITPQVEPVTGSSAGTASLEAAIISPWGAKIGRAYTENGFVLNRSVDPEWPFVWIEFYGRQPFAADGVLPGEADGKRESKVEFRFAPLTDGEAVSPNLTYTTRDGSVITLEHLKFNATPKERAPVGTVELRLDVKKSEVVEGFVSLDWLALSSEKTPQSFSRGTSSKQGNGRLEGQIRLETLPGSDAKEWILRMTSTENVPSQIRREGRFRTRVRVPIRNQIRGPVLSDFEPNDKRGLYEDLDEGLGILVESDQYWEGVFKGNIHVWAPSRENWRWQLKNVRAFQDRTELPAGYFYKIEPRFWSLSGQCLPDVATSHSYSVRLDEKQRPKKLWFSMELEGQGYREYPFYFQTLPISEVQTQQINQAAQGALGEMQDVVLHSQRAFYKTSDLSGLKPEDHGLKGTAFVLEIPSPPAGWSVKFDEIDAQWLVGAWQKPTLSTGTSFFSWGNLIEPEAVPTPGRMFVTLMGSTPPEGVTSGGLSGNLKYIEEKTVSSLIEVKDVVLYPPH